MGYNALALAHFPIERLFMLDTLLFDLDDTLLINPMEQFLQAYFRALTKHLAHLVPTDRLVPELLKATQRMMTNRDPQHTNEQVFDDTFYPALGVTKAALRPAIDQFYEQEFPKLHHITQLTPEARLVLTAAQAHGYQFVIATNPVFPLRAIEHRLDWAGVGDCEFLFITSYETMHFTKPHPEYYREITTHIKRSPERCLMVGNEWANDIAPAQAVGMRTFWVTESREAEVRVTGAQADYQGTLADLRRLIESGALKESS